MFFEDGDEVLEPRALAQHDPVREVVNGDFEVDATQFAEQRETLGSSKGAEDLGRLQRDGEVAVRGDGEFVGV